MTQNDAVTAMHSFFGIPADDTSYDDGIKTFYQVACGSVLSVYPFPNRQIPDDLISSTVIPIMAGYTSKLMKNTGKTVETIKEGDGSVTFRDNYVEYSTDIADYLRFILPYKHLRTPERG